MRPLPPRCCKLLRRRGRVCPRPGPSLGSPLSVFQERFEECKDKLSPFLKGCGYNVKKDVVFVPISALTAANVIAPFSEPGWIDGHRFLEALLGPLLGSV